jgi:phosphoglycerate dehydrogenase-like enzyme
MRKAFHSFFVGPPVLAFAHSVGARFADPADHFWLAASAAGAARPTVLIACALAPEATGLIDASRLALMKPGAMLINVARARIVDEDALYAALKDGHLGGAALDVWWQYPTEAEPERRPSRRPFHELPNVLMTPHSSSSSGATADRRWSAVAGNLDRFARGEPLQNVVLQT